MVRQQSVLLEKKMEAVKTRKNEAKLAEIDVKIQKLRNAISKLETQKRKLQRADKAGD